MWLFLSNELYLIITACISFLKQCGLMFLKHLYAYAYMCNTNGLSLWNIYMPCVSNVEAQFWSSWVLPL